MSDTPAKIIFVNEKAPMVRSMARNGIGRPSKGERDAILAKPPLAFGEILKERAEQHGMSYGDYLVALAAEALQMPQFAPRPPRDRTSELNFPQEAHSAAA